MPVCSVPGVLGVPGVLRVYAVYIPGVCSAPGVSGVCSVLCVPGVIVYLVYSRFAGVPGVLSVPGVLGVPGVAVYLHGVPTVPGACNVYTLLCTFCMQCTL